MSKEKEVDLDTLRRFYNPHPGFAGALIPIPAPVKKVADELNGQKLSLREALKRIRAVATGKLSVVAGDVNFIMLSIGTERVTRHGFRVICFR